MNAHMARHALIGGLAASLLALASYDVSAGLAVMAGLTLPIAFVLHVRAVDSERRLLFAIFLAAVAARAVVAITAEYGASFGFFSVDNHRYAKFGWQLAEHWAGRAAFPDELNGPIGYYRWNALIFTLVGHVPLAPALGNAVVGGLSALLAHSLAREIAGPRAAAWAAGLAAFWPSLVLWSSLNLKDSLAILSILLLLRGAQKLQVGVSALGLALGAAGFLLLAQLRDYLVLIAAVAVGVAWLAARLRAAPLMTGTLLLASAVVIGLVGGVQELGVSTGLETIDEARGQLAIGASAYHGDADVSTAWGALRFLPVGVGYFLLAPAPWQLLNARHVLTLPEMLLWYALLPSVVLGIASSLRERFAVALPVASFSLLVTVSYALVEGNLGTAYRHRAQVLVLFLVFAGVGIEARSRRRSAAVEPELAAQGAPA